MTINIEKFNAYSLPEKNHLYQKMIEEIQEYAIILMDKEGYIQNWNRGAQKIKLYTEEEILGKHFSVFYLQQDLENNLPQRLMNEAQYIGRALQEGWRKRKDGTKFWGSIAITALHDEDENIIGYCKVTRDLTDKKIAEDKLRVSEERYHQMIAEVQDYAIILLSTEGVIENWNIGAEHIKGYTSEEVVGKKFELFYTEQDRKKNLPYQLLAEAKEKGKALQEGWRLRKDGSKFWGTIVITALHNKEGDVIGFSKVTRNLTEKKIAEEKLAAYTAELEIQNSELEQFAYVASHDLQEPLRKIQTFTELIQANFQNKEFVNIYFKKLDASAKRMSELVKALLNYSRLSKEKEIYLTLNLNELFKEVKEDFELLIEERKAEITCDPFPHVSGNRIQLGQLFSNLVSNSLKFCIERPVVKISNKIISKDQLPDPPKHLIHDQYLHITFEDNGIGFEKQYAQVIFSLFQRLHSKQNYAGTGIGLALCKKIVENHLGYINAQSEEGKGAVFNVFLPYDRMSVAL